MPRADGRRGREECAAICDPREPGAGSDGRVMGAGQLCRTASSVRSDWLRGGARRRRRGRWGERRTTEARRTLASPVLRPHPQAPVRRLTQNSMLHRRPRFYQFSSTMFTSHASPSVRRRYARKDAMVIVFMYARARTGGTSASECADVSPEGKYGSKEADWCMEESGFALPGAFHNPYLRGDNQNRNRR